MKKRNVVLISVDEVRPDHLSCYGYQKIKTHNIDMVSESGVLFERCIAAGCFTPICMSSVLCGVYPNRHTVRDPFCRIQSKTIAEIFQECGYNTAGFVGNGVLGTRHGFGAGFDHFDQPTGDTTWGTWEPEKGKEIFHEGNWWVDRMLNWLRDNYLSTFFIWGHYYETHEGAERKLLREGLIKKGELSEFSYKDAKIKYMDEKLFGGLLKVLEELKLWENTTLIIMGDHGTNLGEHPAKLIPHRSGGIIYPQHMSLHDVNIRVPLIIKDKDLPQGRRVKGMVRSVDVVPTLLDLLEMPREGINFDGIGLLPMIAKGKAEGLTAYAEDLYDYASEEQGSSQAFRSDKFKFIRDLTKWTEEFYDLQADALEQNNLIENVRKFKEQQLEHLRKKMNVLLVKTKGTGVDFSKKEKEEIENRLRGLGYME